jgi:hypothetical protein
MKLATDNATKNVFIVGHAINAGARLAELDAHAYWTLDAESATKAQNAANSMFRSARAVAQLYSLDVEQRFREHWRTLSWWTRLTTDKIRYQAEWSFTESSRLKAEAREAVSVALGGVYL